MENNNLSTVDFGFDINITVSQLHVHPEPVNDLVETVLIAVSLSLMIMCMIFGNILVIIAIIVEKDLRRSQYYLILSLAVADLLVGVMVSPLAAIYEIHKEWHFGYIMCDVWTCFDVLVCTSSILHLVAIALDRYWSITDVAYTQKRTPQRIGIMILIVWIVSLVISIAPLLGWKDKEYETRVENHNCLISQDIVYQICGTITAFYAPLVIICVLYYKIFKAAQHRIRLQQQRRSSIGLPVHNKVVIMRKKNIFTGKTTLTPQHKLSLPAFSPTPSQVTSERLLRGSEDFSASKEINLIFPRKSIDGLSLNNDSERGTPLGTPPPMMQSGVSPKVSVSFWERSSIVSTSDVRKVTARKRESIESKRERRAGRTLAIITSIFVMCWVPFFILALYRPMCSAWRGETCFVPHALESLLGWLGYMNSALNPVLYTIFSPDFRLAFKKIVRKICIYLLCCSDSMPRHNTFTSL